MLEDLFGHKLVQFERGQGRDLGRKIIVACPFTANSGIRQNEVADLGRMFQPTAFTDPW